MKQEYENQNRYYAQTAYQNYNSNGSYSGRGRFEKKNSFRKGFSQYDMQKKIIIAGENCKWDSINCSGVPIDYDEENNLLYVDGSDSHTLLYGSTGSKKSRLVVIPAVHTIAAAGENIIICDPKGEIYNRTSAFLRNSGYRINTINLREPQKGDGWNMLYVPYKLFINGEIDKACEFINDATISLIPITAKDPYWDYSARDMLFGLILLLFQICSDKNQSCEIVNMMSVLKLREELFCSSYSSEIKCSPIWEYAKQFDLIRMRLNGIVVCPEKTLSCIVSTFDQHMTCFMLQPQVVKMLSVSTFDFNQLGFEKNAIFLIMPDEKTTYHKIVTIFIKQIYEFLIDNAYKQTKNNRFPIRINFLLDEFSSLPAISDFPQMISASRSRNIRFTLVVQSKHQLKQRYQEETETIISNCGNWMFLASREIELLKEISELAGTTTSNNEKLISIAWLQHLNKDKGQCLVFSGRKYPYLATLPDIDVYDKKKYETQKIEFRESFDFDESYYFNDYFKNILLVDKQNNEVEKFSLDDLFVSESSKAMSKPTIPPNNGFDEKEEISLDLKKELDDKFEELFGVLDKDDKCVLAFQKSSVDKK